MLIEIEGVQIDNEALNCRYTGTLVFSVEDADATYSTASSPAARLVKINVRWTELFDESGNVAGAREGGDSEDARDAFESVFGRNEDSVYHSQAVELYNSEVADCGYAG